MIENADFKYGTGIPSFWNENSDCDSSDTLLSAIQNDPGVPGLDRSAFEMNGLAAKSKALYQTLNVKGGANDTFVVGGWARGDSVPLDQSGRYFALDVGFKRSDGTYDWHVVPFNEDSSDWQYASDKVAFNPTANGPTYTSVSVYLLYYQNLNTVYFDGIQLYKEEFESTNTLDSNGNQTSTKDVIGNTSSAKYDSATNEVTSTTDPLGHTTTYDYTNPDTNVVTHNLYKSVSAAGVVTRYTYDSAGYGNVTSATIGDTTTDQSNLHITSSTAYSSDGNYVSSTKDPSGNTVQFNYDLKKGTLGSVTDANSNTTNYSYDPNNDRLTSVSANVTAYGSTTPTTVTNSYGYTNNNLTSITHNGFNYGFVYDNFGSVVNTTVAGRTLVTNTYDPATRNLSNVQYGNGQQVDYTFDDLDRVTSVKADNDASPRFNYTFDASGDLGYKEDHVNGVNYWYIYDLGDRLTRIMDSNGNITSLAYDKGSNTNSLSDKVNGTTYTTQYTYDNDNRPSTVTNNSGIKVTNSYDTVGRLSSSSIGFTSPYNTTYSYVAGANGSSTALLGTISNNNSNISYTYDKNGNIATITQNGKTITYYYNELNELTREDNEVLGETIVYSYDAGGNILSRTQYPYSTASDLTSITPTQTDSYGYDSTWKDLLTSYDGKTLSYDNIGNLTNDGTYSYTWEMGRQLKTISGNGDNISYNYDDNGIRTQKTVNGVTTYYHLVGDKVTYETNGTDRIYYTYDSNDNLVSMNLNGVEYYYVRDGQGDIIGLLDSTGTQVVTYTYDTWGVLKSIDGSLKDTVGVKNPYRYRGYRYDTETGLYYLQSRYYNPEWGRFVNEDALLGSMGELISHNMFAYCRNNPVDRFDPDGYNEAIDAGFGGGFAAEIGDALEEELAAQEEAAAIAEEEKIAAEEESAAMREAHKLQAEDETKGAAKAESEVTDEATGIDLHRPYIRKAVRTTVEDSAPKTGDGKFIDPNTGLPIEGKYDLGHVPGHEFWREAEKAEAEGLTQKEFNNRMNNPDYYQIEDPSSNRSHKYEMK